MRLTTRGQYAVRALVMLVLTEKDGPVNLKRISEKEGISLHYLEQLFSKLRKGEIVKSVKGPGGGYVLARDPENISVGEVIEMVDEPISPVFCVDHSKDASACHRSGECTTQWLWAELGDCIRDYLNSVSIHEVCEKARSRGLSTKQK
ncbi:MAG: Rrf2 family transcriptional regulator [Deltaproteobacteria bacterium]|nr:Rrf2 family transcriptional regulator [Candidatus Zymogenaceae bacterium]